MTVTNPTEQEISCENFMLLDSDGPKTTANPHIVFRPVEGKADCFGGSCSIYFLSPPPHIVVWGSVGPYAPGETKVCEFSVEILLEFEETIKIVGSGESFEVSRTVSVGPSLNKIGLGVLLLSVIMLGFFSITRIDTRGNYNA